MYSGPVDAFESTVGEIGSESVVRITQLSGPNSRLANGIRYCFVEVTSDSGMQFAIEAFDEEADKLYQRASRFQLAARSEISPMAVIIR